MSRVTEDGGIVSAFKEPRQPKKKAWWSTVAHKSDKRADRRPVEERLFKAILERDGGCVVAGEPWVDGTHECSGPDTPHHRRKASGGGEWTMANLVVLCVGANTDVEDFPSWVRENYPWLVVRFGDREWDELGGQR